jgi:hypothetical protein
MKFQLALQTWCNNIIYIRKLTPETKCIIVEISDGNYLKLSMLPHITRNSKNINGSSSSDVHNKYGRAPITPLDANPLINSNPHYFCKLQHSYYNCYKLEPPTRLNLLPFHRGQCCAEWEPIQHRSAGRGGGGAPCPWPWPQYMQTSWEERNHTVRPFLADKSDVKG